MNQNEQDLAEKAGKSSCTRKEISYLQRLFQMKSQQACVYPTYA
jgi:hypothetical protein